MTVLWLLNPRRRRRRRWGNGVIQRRTFSSANDEYNSSTKKSYGVVCLQTASSKLFRRRLTYREVFVSKILINNSSKQARLPNKRIIFRGVARKKYTDSRNPVVNILSQHKTFQSYMFKRMPRRSSDEII